MPDSNAVLSGVTECRPGRHGTRNLSVTNLTSVGSIARCTR